MAPSDQLPLAEERLRALVEQIPAVTYIDELEEDGSAIYVSPQLESVLGYPAEAWLEHSDFWAKHLHPDDLNRVWAEYERARDAGESMSQQYRMIAADGRTVWIDERAVLLRDEDGSPMAYQGVLFDITQLKETEERLRDSDAAKDTLLHAVSHDLKNPLFAIEAIGRTLSLTDVDEVDRASLLTGLQRSAHRAIGIITDLLDLERLADGLIDPQREPVRVDELVAGAAEDLAAISDEPIDLRLEPVELATDAARLRRVIDNLLVNALEHTPAGTAVRAVVARTDDGGGVQITIEDHGPGLESERAERLLSGTILPGEGLGLSIVARFCAALGGNVTYVPADGARFVVWLPDPGLADPGIPGPGSPPPD